MGARLVVRLSGRPEDNAEHVYEFDQQRVVLGRATWSDVRLPHAAVSEHHASIQVQGSGYVIHDEGSTNGTYVAGARLVPHRPKPLRSTETFRIGPFDVEFTGGVPVADRTSLEGTASLARRMLRHLIRPSLPCPRLVALHGPNAGLSVQIPDEPSRLTVGRGKECDVTLTDAEASRLAAELVVDPLGVTVLDRESKNGLLVNGKGVTERRLRDRDEIQIGASVFVFEDPVDPALKALEERPDEPCPPPSLPMSRTTLAEPQPASPAANSARARSKDSTRGAELLIYILAAVVLAASAAGLLWLLRAE